MKRVFFLIFARDRSGVDGKVEELSHFGFSYVVICGEKLYKPNVVYREPRGKYDAVNFASEFLPAATEIVALNDVDTRIHNIEGALALFERKDVSLVFVRVNVETGPQTLFYPLLDSIRTRIPIAASGELMLMRKEVFREILPLKGCKSEDSYILFKALEHGHNVVFSKDCYVTTKRTSSAEQEEDYKRRTTGGDISSALNDKSPNIGKTILFAVATCFSLPARVGQEGVLLGERNIVRLR